MGTLIYLACTLALVSLCNSAKILVVFPFPNRSHSILGEGFVRVLAEAGHEVTYITPYPMKNPYPKMRQVDVSDNISLDIASKINITAIMNKEIDVFSGKEVFKTLTEVGRATLNNENMVALLNEPSVTFDVIIIEWMLVEMLSGLSAVYDCPFIWSSSIEPHSPVMQLIDEGLNPAYNPSFLSTSNPPYSFIERIKELFIQVGFAALKTFLFLPQERTMYAEKFGPLLEKKGKILPPYDEVRYNASLMFGNSHVALGQATRLPQSYIPIAGYHINPKVPPLPNDLKVIMDNAKNGVIFFSMGSNVKSKHMTDEMKNSFLKLFGELPYTVLWKFEDKLPNLPKNVHIIKWAPQPSILSHPNLKLFITHGGLLSTTEAVYYGVPLVGIPVFGDQFVNIDRAVNKGFAKRVELSYDMFDELKSAIKEVLENPSFTERAKQLSFILHDRPVPSHKELVHWVEHVVRTGGAPHLRSPALHVPIYQKLYLDFAALVTVILIVISYVLKKMCCSYKKASEKIKRN